MTIKLKLVPRPAIIARVTPRLFGIDQDDVVLKAGDTMNGTLSMRLPTPTLALDVQTPDAVASPIASSASLVKIFDGEASAPHTDNTPTVAIYRRDALNSDTFSGSAPALWVETFAVGTGSGNPNSAAINGYATQFGKGDVVGTTGQSFYIGSDTGYYSFGGFFTGYSNKVGSGCFGIEVNSTNSTGVDVPYTNLTPYPSIVGIHVQEGGANLGTTGIWIGAAALSGYQFDVGIACTTGSIRTAALQDDSSSITIVKATGSHTDGIDLSAATFSGSPFKSTGFEVSSTGGITTPSLALPAWVALGALTITSTGGNFTTASATGSALTMGKTVFFVLSVGITTVGPGTGAIIVTLPFTAGSGTCVASGTRANDNHLLSVVMNVSSTTINIFHYDGATAITAGGAYSISGVTEIA